MSAALKSIATALAEGGRQRVSLLPDLAGLRAPVTVIWGSADRIVPSTHAGGLPSSFAIHVIDGAGHMVHMERAKEVNAILVRAVSGTG